MSHKIVAVFGSSRAQPGDGLYELGCDVGRRLAEAGFGVTNGGYGGLMEAASAGAVGAGGAAIGVTAPVLFPGRPGGNAFLTDEIPAASLTERIHVMSESACAAIVLPGSIGTFTELMIVWNDAFITALRGERPRPVIAIRSAWESVVDRLTETLDTRAGLISFVDTPAEAVELLERLLDSTNHHRDEYVEGDGRPA